MRVEPSSSGRTRPGRRDRIATFMAGGRVRPRMALAGPLRKPGFLEGVRAPLLAAVVLTFLLDVALAPPNSALGLVARGFGFAIAAGVQVVLGMWLGKRTWPRRGHRLARGVVKRMLRGEPMVMLTDRPDRTPNLARRMLEVLGFAAGASVLAAATLPLLGLGGGNVFALAGTLTLFTLWGTFILVPYWLFSRMGLRRVDPVLRVVEPLSRRYADRLRLSNGALLLVALGASVNLAFRAGLSGEEALIDGTRSLVGLITSIFLVATAATTFYAHQEKALVRTFEEEALRLGVRDGRGMSDGEFMPRLARE